MRADGVTWTKSDARRARREKARLEDEAEERRRRENPTDEERLLNQLKTIEDAEIYGGDVARERISELARLLRWHITGQEF